MGIKLVAIDLDGTLLNDEGKILPNSIKVLKHIRNEDVKVVLTTGRPLVSVKPFLEELGLNNSSKQYVITFNGSIIEDTNGKVIQEATFNFQTFVDFELWADNINLYNQLETQDTLYTTSTCIPIDGAHESWKNKLQMKVTTLHDLIEIPKKPAMLKIMAVSTKEKLDKIQNTIPKVIKEKLNLIRSEPEYLDFAAPNVDKGWALRKLAQYLGLKDNEIMAIGNADNDIPMIDFAGIGIAMEASTPRLLEIADYVTTSNNVDGIEKAIQKYVVKD
ncbi:Cof-type HAD-IIB family hydrolase [uncultured Lactobacillus sp.]|uniref:Cof-type HAD-IIB family hydrolase n=1 Tax=uncultured Lactobacillus sp. TaxID=153152 RepID=UPI00261590EC|nr:Cof-type HAD-IIB family hydrolase [uncultured Lactobacillus sp.]